MDGVLIKASKARQLSKAVFELAKQKTKEQEEANKKEIQEINTIIREAITKGQTGIDISVSQYAKNALIAAEYAVTEIAPGYAGNLIYVIIGWTSHEK